MDALAIRIVFAAALALLAIGAIASATSANVVKRLGGAFIALVAAVLCAASLGAPASVLAVAAAILFATLVLGAALIVRLQEAYGSVELRDLNAADADSERAGPMA